MKEQPGESPDPIREHTEHTEQFIREEEEKKALKKTMLMAPGHRAEVVSVGPGEFTTSCTCGWKMDGSGTAEEASEAFGSHALETGSTLVRQRQL